jgi:Eukaryotic-type carbonic anhydrase
MRVRIPGESSGGRSERQHSLRVQGQGISRRAEPSISRAVPRAEGERVAVVGRPTRDTSSRMRRPRGLGGRIPVSLTTPPCTEGVRWEIFDEAIETSKAQIDRYTGVYDDNRRPLQLLHGRRPALGGGPTARPGR